MQIVNLRAEEEFIKLGQALKKAGFEESGADAKADILEGRACVNGEVDTRRGKKLYPGDVVEYTDHEGQKQQFRIESAT